MADIEIIKRKVKLASSEYGLVTGEIILFDFPGPDGIPTMNCGVDGKNNIQISPLLLELETTFVLAVIAHELGHIALGHTDSDHTAEYEADEQSLVIMEFWGISPKVTLDIHTIFSRMDSYTHPGSENRVENIREAILDSQDFTF
jgi:hypothetical protein